MLWACLGGSLRAMPDSLETAYPFSLLQTPRLATLEGPWYEEDGKLREIPLMDTRLKQLAVYTHFQLDCLPPDTLFLYLQGAGWQVEVELNERYLGVFDHPLQVQHIPLLAQWLRPHQPNQLKINLTVAKGRPFHPTPFLSMLYPPLLVDKDQLRVLKQNPLPRVAAADTVALVAPYYRSHAYCFDLADAYRLLHPLIKHRIRHIFFLYPPDRQLRALCAQLGFVEVESFDEGNHLFFLNEYPYDPACMDLVPNFWIDKSGYRTADYHSFFQPLRTNAARLRLHYSISWVVLIPLLGLLLIKILNPGFFYAMPAILLKPKLFIDHFSDASYSNLALIWALQLIKLLCLAGTVALFILYIKTEHQWELLNAFREQSLAYRLFQPVNTLWGVFFRTALVLMLFYVGRHLLNSLLGYIFRIKGMALGMLNLDLVGSYPLVLALMLPVILLLFAQEQWAILPLLLASGTALLYIVRKLYVFFMGLERLFSFSFTVKILYICALNIIPYIIWF